MRYIIYSEGIYINLSTSFIKRNEGVRAMRHRTRERTEDIWDTDDIYSGFVVDELLEDDELSTQEEAFMRGYEHHRRGREDYY